MRSSLVVLVGMTSLLLLTSRVKGQGVKEMRCLMECYRCVKTYGMKTFDGQLCANNCAETNGNSINPNCYPPTKRTEGDRAMSVCSSQCELMCSPHPNVWSRRQHRPPARGACIVPCLLSNGRILAC